MTYHPKPIDTSRVELPIAIERLIEQLAENTHDHWASRRLAEGWTWGPRRDDKRRKHPCLVPYAELSEKEKNYDRQTSVEALKAVMALNYRIQPREEKETAQESLASPTLIVPAGLNLKAALDLWAAGKGRNQGSEFYTALAQRILRLGEPLLAHDVANEGAKRWPGHLRLTQLLALALLRAKATDRAVALLRGLRDMDHPDSSSREETLGLLARALKDLAEQDQDEERKTALWQSAFQAYQEAYELTGGYWTGINAAALARVIGRNDEAVVLADRVENQCSRELALVIRKGGDQYWPRATLAECALIRGDLTLARRRYARAARLAGDRYGDLGSTLRNARLLLSRIDVPAARARGLARALAAPRVAVFAGHLIDRPDRASPRFPADREESVREGLRRILIHQRIRVGFAAAACGADILFLETLLDLGGEIHVVLPYEREQFIQDSVDTIPGANWRQRCLDVLPRAKEVLTASAQPLEGGWVPYHYTNLLLFGLARLRAAQLETELRPMAVWDGRPGDGPGGTASIVERWKQAGFKVHVVAPLPTGQRPRRGPRIAARRQPIAPPQGFETELAAVLFADAVNFSKLQEKQVPFFVRHFLGGINELIRAKGHHPLTRETWGDGLYMVFPSAGDAGRFALDLAEFVTTSSWADHQLPATLSLRIALNAGPVYKYVDPLTNRPNYTGMHVTRAARIEPITPHGQVYATMEFAALAAAEGENGFFCDYVGQIPLPKNYGIIPMYHVRRHHGRRGLGGA